MRLLITGLNGTLAPKLATAAQAAGDVISGWDRRAVDPADGDAVQRWLDATAPDAIAHLAMGDAAWAARLAAHAVERAVPLVFTSTAMVFDCEPDGPHRVGDARTARDDYGRMKIACEDAVLAANASACIARIGWQIDADPATNARGNQMLAALDDWQRRDGCIAASRRWIPACSFLQDTAAALLVLLRERQAGVVHLDGNADDALTFDAVARGLARRFGRAGWKVVANDGYVHDQRLPDAARRMPSLSERLAI